MAEKKLTAVQRRALELLAEKSQDLTRRSASSLKSGSAIRSDVYKRLIAMGLAEYHGNILWAKITPAGLAAIASASIAAPEAAQEDAGEAIEVDIPLLRHIENSKPYYSIFSDKGRADIDALVRAGYAGHVGKEVHVTYFGREALKAADVQKSELESLRQENAALKQQFAALVTEIDMLSLSSSMQVHAAREHLLEKVEAMSPATQSVMLEVAALKEEIAKLLKSEQTYHEEVERLRAALQTLVRYVEDNATVLDLPLGLRLRARAARNTLLAAALTEAGE